MEDDCSNDYDNERTQLMHDEENRDTSGVEDQRRLWLHRFLWSTMWKGADIQFSLHSKSQCNLDKW